MSVCQANGSDAFHVYRIDSIIGIDCNGYCLLLRNAHRPCLTKSIIHWKVFYKSIEICRKRIEIIDFLVVIVVPTMFRHSEM